ncbi:MAG: hypothetical protein R3C05_04750 [Pirellulaceae bacterium]
MISQTTEATKLVARLGIVLLLLVIPSCGPRRAAPVDADLAEQTLLRVLETWKSGGTISQLRSADQPVVVQDASWTEGKTLESYTLVGDGWVEDANLFQDVELTFAPEAGRRSVPKRVTYVIGTDPVITVFRAIL